MMYFISFKLPEERKPEYAENAQLWRIAVIG
jgi:hypothetical protein